ncbi:MAG TPA: energy transducer TonB [Vicinamibacterales bacterium]
MEHKPSTIEKAQTLDQTGSTASRVAIAPVSAGATASPGSMPVTRAPANPPVPAERSAAVPEKASEPEAPKTPAPPRRTAADAIYAEMLQRAASPTQAPPRRPAVAPQTPATAEHQQAPVASEHKQSPIVLASFGVLVAALVAGAYSIRSHEQPARAPRPSPAAVVADNNITSAAALEREVPAATPVIAKPIPPPPVPERKPVSVDEHPHPPAPSAASVSQKPAPSAPRKDPAAVRPSATTPARSPRAAAVPAPADKSTRPRGPASDIPARVVTFSPAAEKPAVDVAESKRQPEPEAPTTAAVGPIFDLRDVSEQPKIATQHAPNLPPALRSRATKEVVVVRALVSQSGRPSRISLLRRSKTGPEVDDVILASVNQWTFSPARKKGEPVNCWFNFAVQVGGTD